MLDFETLSPEIDRIVESYRDEDEIPGVALAVTNYDRLLMQRSYGFSTLASHEPLAPDHFFEFGSIGKSFTCILLLQLAEEEGLDLHVPLRKYLPWFDVQSEFDAITPHHLMTHTGGIINGTDFPADPRYEVWALRESRAVHPPGVHFHYSNVGYKALGLMLEAITGDAYPTLVQRRILDPLGMQHTHPAITHETRKHLATGHGYRYDDRPWRRSDGHVAATWLETDTADGCIAGTAEDLATYLRMLMNGGATATEDILSPDSFGRMTTPFATLPPDRLDPERATGGYGYGLYSYTEQGRHILSHSGGMVGYYTHMVADRALGLGVVALINGPGRCASIANDLLDLLNTSSGSAGVASAPPASDAKPAPDLENYAGTYSGADSMLHVDVVGDRLRATMAGHSAALLPYRTDSFIVDDSALDQFLLRFERDASGAVISATHGSAYWSADGVPVPAAPEYPPEWETFPGHYRSHNPWMTNFRIVLRHGSLLLISPGGSEESVVLRGDGVFRVGDEHSPEYITFDTVVDGKAWRARHSGCDFYRFFTP